MKNMLTNTIRRSSTSSNRYVMVSNFSTYRAKVANSNLESFINKLDPPTAALAEKQILKGSIKSKLNSSLDDTLEIKKELSESSKGILDATGNEIADVITDCFYSSKHFRYIFKGAKSVSDVIEIDYVRMNQDCSHATIYWSSPPLIQLADIIRKKLGDKDYHIVLNSANKMNKKLQILEPKLRSMLITKMDFKRVPRLLFKPTSTDIPTIPITPLTSSTSSPSPPTSSMT